MTNRRFWLILASTLGILIPSAVYTNPYWPSFVEHLAMPFSEKMDSLDLLPFLAIVLVPLMVPLVAVEALVARRFFYKQGFWSLFFIIFVANFASGLVGYLLIPKGTLLWPAMTISYVAAVFLEWPVLIWYVRGEEPRYAPSFKASVAANTVSYSLMALVLFCLIYVPVYRTEDRSLIDELKGNLIVARDSNRIIGAVDFSDGTIKRLPSYPRIFPNSRLVCKDTAKGPVIVDTKTGKTIYRFPQTYVRSIAFSPDERYCAAYYDHDDLAIIDLKKSTSKRVVGCHSYPLMAFHPTEPILAYSYSDSIRLYNYRTGTTAYVRAPGRNHHSRHYFIWSPDGKYLAYLSAHVSFFAEDHIRPNLRVINADGKRSVTVAEKIAGSPRYLVWVK